MIKLPNHKMWKNAKKNDWPKRKKVVHAELHILVKQEVFGLVVQMPKNIACWAQMSICMKSTLTVSEGLDVSLTDAINAYLYGSIDNDTYMKIPKGFKLLEENNAKPYSMYSIELQ